MPKPHAVSSPQGNAAPSEILTILDDIIRDEKRAGDVVRNLRAMLSGKPMHREPSCLNELVTEVCQFLTSDLAREGIELQVELNPSPPRINLAPAEIQQVLVNLINNACQAMRETPADERRIFIQTSTSDGFAHLHARDHGHGIPPERLDRIFEPFHSTRSDGLGMGLAICRRVAETHGGTLKAANHESGAVFTLTLPLVFPLASGPS